MKKSQTTHSVDWKLATKRSNDNHELAKELFGLLQRDLPTNKKNIETAYAENDVDTLVNTLHAMNGSCCYCGVPSLENMVKTLETQVRESSMIFSKDQLDQLLSEITTLINYQDSTNDA